MKTLVSNGLTISVIKKKIPAVSVDGEALHAICEEKKIVPIEISCKARL